MCIFRQNLDWGRINFNLYEIKKEAFQFMKINKVYNKKLRTERVSVQRVGSHEGMKRSKNWKKTVLFLARSCSNAKYVLVPDRTPTTRKPHGDIRILFFIFNHLYLKILLHCDFQVYPGEPVYAQVNREKKKNSRNQMDTNFANVYDHEKGYHHSANYAEHGEMWDSNAVTQRPGGQPFNPENGTGGDSWV